MRYDAETLLSKRPTASYVCDPHTTLNAAILAYEVGDLIKCAVNAAMGGARGYQGEAKIAMADTITQLRLLAARLGLDFYDCARLGEDRYVERMAALSRGEYTS